MANVTIPAAGSAASERALAHEALQADRAEEQAKIRRAALDAPWYNEQLDPLNFSSNEYLDPQHIAMFNGTAGGRRAASFPERTLDSGLEFHPTPEGLRPSSGASERDIATTQHPEILVSIIQDLWTPSTSNGALGQALAVATDAPPSIEGPAEPPLTISPPLDPSDLPEVPPEAAPEGSSRAKRQEAWRLAGEDAASTGTPTPKKPQQQPSQPNEDAARQKRETEEKQREAQRQQEEKRRESRK